MKEISGKWTGANGLLECCGSRWLSITKSRADNTEYVIEPLVFYLGHLALDAMCAILIGAHLALK